MAQDQGAQASGVNSFNHSAIWPKRHNIRVLYNVTPPNLAVPTRSVTGHRDNGKICEVYRVNPGVHT